jgi:hypothetical protein
VKLKVRGKLFKKVAIGAGIIALAKGKFNTGLAGSKELTQQRVYILCSA